MTRSAPLLLRQYAAEAGAKGPTPPPPPPQKGKSNVGLFAALAAVGAGGGYYIWTQSGGDPQALLKGGCVDYQKVLIKLCAFYRLK